MSRKRPAVFRRVAHLNQKWFFLLVFILLAGCQGSPVATSTPGSGSIWLPPDNPAYITFPLLETTQVYTFNADPDGTASLTLEILTASLAYTAEVRDSRGAVVATLKGNDVLRTVFTFAPDDGLYEVILKAENPAAQGMVALAFASSANALASSYTQTAAKQVVTEESPPVCQVSGVTGQNVNIHSGPAETYPASVALPPGMFLVTDTVTADGWYRVWFNGDQVGWIAGQYIQLTGTCAGLAVQQPQAAPVSVPAAAPCQATNNVGAGVNVRIGPGMTYTVIGGLYPGTVVNVVGRADNAWYQVSSGGRIGWVAASGVMLSGICEAVALVWQVAAS